MYTFACIIFGGGATSQFLATKVLVWFWRGILWRGASSHVMSCLSFKILQVSDRKACVIRELSPSRAHPSQFFFGGSCFFYHVYFLK